ncbi:unnamed protein product [Cylicostephanus goldi]|uniref:NADP-dependent oxidoreductase domain-containing protein n=1 Tax=Cylicostephanus goldi TaxID=71465 RepID=A0A3P6T150_CYLGO|nr:unnamed protein product [Cylicostephanus goldi]
MPRPKRANIARSDAYNAIAPLAKVLHLPTSSFSTLISTRNSLGNPGSAFFRKDGDPNVLTDPVVKKIAEGHGKTPAQVALRWAIQLDIIVIPKSVSESRIKENVALFDFKLSEEEMKEMEGLDRGWRIVNLSASNREHPHNPYNEEF